MNNKRNNLQRGDAALYIVVLMLIVITSSAITLSSMLSGMLRASQGVVDSERALYASNSGFEDALFQLYAPVGEEEASEPIDTEKEINIEETEVEYEDGVATYEVEAWFAEEEGVVQPCIKSEGKYKGAKRILAIGGDACEFGN